MSLSLLEFAIDESTDGGESVSEGGNRAPESFQHGSDGAISRGRKQGR